MAKQPMRRSDAIDDDPMEVVEGGESDADKMTSALLMLTALCLLIAIIISWSQLGRDYKCGLFGG